MERARARSPGGQPLGRLWREALRAGLALRRRLTARDDGAPDAGDAFYGRLWREAAAALGAEVEDLGGGFLEIRRAGRATRVRRKEVMLDDPVTLELAGDRLTAHRLLSRAGIPVPRQALFSLHDRSPAEALLRASGGACVVKPARGTGGGRGVTTGVRTRRELRRAATHASLFCRELVAEEQVPGDVYRLLYLEGELLDAVRRRPPALLGDGKSSVRELIEAENRRRARAGAEGSGIGPIELDPDCRAALRRAGLSLASRPAAGLRVPVKGISNAGGERDSESVRALIGKDLRTEAGRAAEVLGVRLAGVDVITPDPAQSLHLSGGRIAEVNSTPGLGWHYRICNPEEGVRVALPILARLLSGGELPR